MVLLETWSVRKPYSRPTQKLPEVVFRRVRLDAYLPTTGSIDRDETVLSRTIVRLKSEAPGTSFVPYLTYDQYSEQK
ncbi:hypothetical protein KY285_020897 [Solanum tuberosum]|nr:hypothetical protein KY285_020897 [Solanum tuberosum]